MYLLKNCHLIKSLVEGVNLEFADVLIRNDKIEKIVPCDTITYEGESFDLERKTLLPGLIDAHIHLRHGKEYTGLMVPTACGRSFDCLKFAQFLLNIGITTVRDMGDDENFPTIALRNAIQEGVVIGPNVITSGLTISPFESGFQAGPNINAFVTGPIEMRKTARRMLMYGADVIKIYGTGSMLTIGSQPGLRILEEDEILEAVAVANRKGTYVACHCHGAEAIDTMVRCGVRTIEHASFITDATCQMLDGREDVGIVPTVGLLSDLRLENASASIKNRYEQIREEVFAAIRNAYRYNIQIGWGTDIPLDLYQAHPDIEFRTRKENLGFSNLDILKQATINSARLIRMDDKVGTVKEGKLADLIVVDGDPVENIEVMYRAPLHVMKSGKWVR